jgi:hypothetical protein
MKIISAAAAKMMSISALGNRFLDLRLARLLIFQPDCESFVRRAAPPRLVSTRR